MRTRYFSASKHVFFRMARAKLPVHGHHCIFSRAFTTVTVSRCTVTSKSRDCTMGTLGLFGSVHRFLSAPKVLRPGCYRHMRVGKRSVVVVLVGMTSHVHTTVGSPILSQRVRRSVTVLHGSFVRPRFGTLLRAMNPGKRFVSAGTAHAVGPNRYVRAS